MVKKNSSLKLLLLSNSVIYLALGLFGPFYLIFIEKIGGSIENFGFAMGLMIIAGSLTTYLVGKYSDRFGRKIFLIIGGLVSSVIIFSYTLIDSLMQLYILQILNGIFLTTHETAEYIFLTSLVDEKKKGEKMGGYYGLIGFFVGIATMLGGVLVGKFGFEIIFYLCSGLVLVGSLLLLRIKE